MRVVVAPDKFKGTASASEIAKAIAGAVREAGHEAVVVPMADGGDGTLEAPWRPITARRRSPDQQANQSMRHGGCRSVWQ